MDNKLHIIKLCVGCSSPEELQAWQDTRADPLRHVTRMWPKRADEIAGLGSIYWVMNGEIRCRQGITGFSEVIGEDGIRRCGIEFDRELVLVRPALRRPFQGWRYLKAEDAPPDLPKGERDALPPELEDVLNRLGVG